MFCLLKPGMCPKDFTCASNSVSMCADDTTIWLAKQSTGSGTLYAYKISDKSRDSDKDITLISDSAPYGTWTDGTTYMGSRLQ